MFVVIFVKIGIIFVVGLINFVVLIVVMLGCNLGIFSVSCMIYIFVYKGEMLKIFIKIMRNGVLLYIVIVVFFGILIGVLLNVILFLYIDGVKSIFVYVYSVFILLGMIFWFMILFSYLCFRKLYFEELEGYLFKMFGGVVINYLIILFLILVLVGMVFNVEIRILVLIGVIFLMIVMIYYFIRYNKNNVKVK